MKTTNVRQQMDNFFDIIDERYQTSLFINMQLQKMSKEKMRKAFQKFGLGIVSEYLDIRTINNHQYINGFIRYMDAYLIEMSGGKRTELLKLGKELTGYNSKAFSLRLVRLDIISHYLSEHLF